MRISQTAEAALATTPRAADPIDELFQHYRESGDSRVLGRVFRRARPNLTRAARRWTHDPDEIDDLVQSTFLAALTASETFDENRRVMPWLRGILNNRSRRLHRDADRLPDPARCRPPAGPPDPLSHALASDLADRICRAIRQAPVMTRTVLELHIHHGLQPTDIARWLRRPTSTVRTQLRRGLRHLRVTLAKAC